MFEVGEIFDGSTFKETITSILEERGSNVQLNLEVLSTAMKNMRLNPFGLAIQMGVAESSVRRWLQGKGILMTRVARLAEILNVDSSTLIVKKHTPEIKAPTEIKTGKNFFALNNFRGDLLKKARIEAGLSYNELGAKIGVHGKTILRWEEGMIPLENNVVDLSRVLGIPYVDLIKAPVDEDNSDPKYFRADLLTEARFSKNLSKEELAKHIGVAYCTVNAWEKGRIPKKERIEALSKFFNIPYSKFITPSEEKITKKFNSEAMRTYRLAIGLKRIDLAQALGMKDTTINNWESGKYTPRYENIIIKIAEMLGVPPVALYASSQTEIESYLTTQHRPEFQPIPKSPTKIDTQDELMTPDLFLDALEAQEGQDNSKPNNIPVLDPIPSKIAQNSENPLIERMTDLILKTDGISPEARIILLRELRCNH